MNRTETDVKSKVFWSILFTVTFLFAAQIVPRLGITFSFLSFGGRISVSRVTPDILLSLVVICSMICSSRLACMLGLIFGFAYDATVGIPYLLSPILYTVGGIVSPKLSESFASKGVFSVMVSGAELFLVKSIITAFYHLAAWREVHLTTLVVGTLLPELLYNLIALCVMYFVTVFLARLFRVEIDA